MRISVILLAFSMSLASAAQADEESDCFDAVQGKVAWNQAGDKQWQPGNIEYLCAKTPDHLATIGCFEAAIASGKPWEDAIQGCKPKASATAERLGMSVYKSGEEPAPTKRTGPPQRGFLNNLVCTTKQVSITDSFDANYVGKSEALRKVLIPGAVFYMNDLLNGSFNPVANNSRLPYTIYVGFNDRTGELTGTEDELFEQEKSTDTSLQRDVDGSFSNVQGAISSIVTSRPYNANFASSFEVHEIVSDSQLNIALNAAAS